MATVDVPAIHGTMVEKSATEESACAAARAAQETGVLRWWGFAGILGAIVFLISIVYLVVFVGTNTTTAGTGPVDAVPRGADADRQRSDPLPHRSPAVRPPLHRPIPAASGIESRAGPFRGASELRGTRHAGRRERAESCHGPDIRSLPRRRGNGGAAGYRRADPTGYSGDVQPVRYMCLHLPLGGLHHPRDRHAPRAVVRSELRVSLRGLRCRPVSWHWPRSPSTRRRSPRARSSPLPYSLCCSDGRSTRFRTHPLAEVGRQRGDASTLGSKGSAAAPC